jgi:hypothetical protein
MRNARSLARALARYEVFVTRPVHTFALDGSVPWNGAGERAAAMFRITPDELEARCGISWLRGNDQLDFDRRAGLVLPSGQHVILQWYERAPEPRGVVLYVDRSDDLPGVRAQTLAVLGLANADVSWIPESDVRAG